MKNCIMIILTGVGILISCAKDSRLKEDNISSVKCNYYNVLEEEIKLSNLFDHYEFIALEGDKADHKQIFGEINKMVAYKDRLIILDKEVTNRIFVYDTSGKFIFSTENGRGPEELLRIEDFCVNDEDNSILILANGNRSIKIFSLSDGRFLKAIPLNDYFAGIDYVSANKVILINNASTALEEYDGCQIISTQLNDLEKITLAPILINNSNLYQDFGSGHTTFMKTDSSIYFSEAWGNNIYMFSKKTGEVVLNMQIDFGQTCLSNYSDDIKNAETLTKYSIESAYLAGIGGGMSDKDIIYIVANVQEINYLFVDKDLTTCRAFKKIENDLYDIPIIAFMGYSGKGEAYTYISVETIQAYLDKGVELSPSLKSKLEDFDVLTSHPIIVKLYNK